MNRISKPVTIRFFSIEAHESFFKDFTSSFRSNVELDSNTRIFNIRSKKHLIKTGDVSGNEICEAFPVTVVRERNTWQTKATKDGSISGISRNQGIIGDPYYFCVIPDRKIILGFTTGPSVSLKSVGKTMLDQFNADRLSHIKINLIPKEKEFSTLNELPEYSSLHFKINSSSLFDVASDAPQLIKELSSAPYIDNNMQLSLDLQIDADSESERTLTKDNVIEIVNYLSNHDGCTVLKVKGVDGEGNNINLDFGNAFYNYKTEIKTRNMFIDESSALSVLNSALREYFSSMSPK